jgi:sugar lactone lactonase YvrE
MANGQAQRLTGWFLVTALAGITGLAQNRSDADKKLPNPYQTIEHYFKMPAGRTLGSSSAIDIDPDGTSVWVADRCAAGSCLGSDLAPVFKFDAAGNVVKNFGGGMFVYPHGIHVDRQGNVWVVDGQSNMTSRGRGGRGAAASSAPAPAPAAPKVPMGMQVIKFSPDGTVLLKLGTAGVPGTDGAHFNRPSDVVTAPNGDIFVADGHGGDDSNARIVKFTKDGTFVKAWGHQGSGPGEFDAPHSITIDSQGRLFVADRANSRIQIFDQDGKFLDQWKQFGRPSGVYVDRNDVLYAADSESNTPNNHNEYQRGIHVGSARTGVVTAFIPDPMGNIDEGAYVVTSGAEGVAGDKNGVMYGVQVRPYGIFKYVKK